MDNNRLNQYSLGIAMLLSLLLAWSGAIDKQSSGYIENSITETGVIFGTARGIDAVVSVAQGTEIDLPALTIAFGEVLDPVNDLIERFSGLMTLALASVILQKILLGLLASGYANSLFSIIVIGLLAASWHGNLMSVRTAFRWFLVACFFRFSITLVALANAMVDHQFLDGAESKPYKEMVEYKELVGALTTLTSAVESETADQEYLDQQISQASAKARLLQEELSQLQAEVQNLQAEKNVICEEQPLPFCKSFPGTPKPEGLEKLGSDIENLKTRISATESKLEQEQSTIDCHQRRKAGKVCSIMERFEIPSIKEKIALLTKKLDARTSAFVDNALSLLMAVLLKSVAIPLLFLYLLILCVRRAFHNLSSSPNVSG